MGITTQMVDYKPYTVQIRSSKAKQREPVKPFAFPGQYTTTSHRDFCEKETARSAQNTPFDFAKIGVYSTPQKRLLII